MYNFYIHFSSPFLHSECGDKLSSFKINLNTGILGNIFFRDFCMVIYITNISKSMGECREYGIFKLKYTYIFFKRDPFVMKNILATPRRRPASDFLILRLLT